VLTGEPDQQPAGFGRVIHDLTRHYGTPEIPHLTYSYQTGVDQPTRTVMTMYLRVPGDGGITLKSLLTRLGSYSEQLQTLRHAHPTLQPDLEPTR
jgi:hypothetical protein